MKEKPRLRVAIQKSGRLNNDSLDLLSRCGLKIRMEQNSLLRRGENLPIDVLLVRDDDIPTLVANGVCDLGIVGENVLFEKTARSKENKQTLNLEIIKQLGFCRCRLSIALPNKKKFEGPVSLQGLRIATSYPNLLQNYLVKHHVKAEALIISGSVEIAPGLGMADAICDLVSTGRTLEENNLKEVAELIQSQAVLIKSTTELEKNKNKIYELMLRRIESVLRAQESKYIMFHAPKTALDLITHILPGCETPTVMPLEGIPDKVAVHTVSREGVFWITLEKLKQAGASSILVLPIEKMLY